ALTQLPDVDGVNVQFRDGPATSMPDIETAASLAIDSRQMTGSDSRRKPITSELFDVLCDVAAARGHAHFGYINSDIVVLPALLEAIARRPCETYAISRCDVPDLNGNPSGGAMLTSGIDMFIV